MWVLAPVRENHRLYQGRTRGKPARAPRLPSSAPALESHPCTPPIGSDFSPLRSGSIPVPLLRHRGILCVHLYWRQEAMLTSVRPGTGTETSRFCSLAQPTSSPLASCHLLASLPDGLGHLLACPPAGWAWPASSVSQVTFISPVCAPSPVLAIPSG